jgi:glutamate-1-semialdehyde aminotransferase
MNYLAPLGPVYQAGTLSGKSIGYGCRISYVKSLDADRDVFIRLKIKQLI